METKKYILCLLLIGISALFISISVWGGFGYFFERDSFLEQNTILTSCNDLKGQLQWHRLGSGLDSGCDGKKCFIETCIILK